MSGYYFWHPDARYFGVGRIGRDQVEDYARRKGMPVEEVERWLAPNLGYERQHEAASRPDGRRRVHVLDGAMGTMLYSRGVFVNVCYDELTLKQPALVQEVHERYVRAGAEILETNTFGANPVKLSAFGLDDRTEEINRAAGELAHRAARGRAAVVGAIGPLGIRHRALGTDRAGPRPSAFFARQATRTGPGWSGRVHPGDLQRPARRSTPRWRRRAAWPRTCPSSPR